MINIFEFNNAIEPLETVFKPMDEGQRKIYFDHLKKLDEWELKEIIEYLVENCRYFPKIAEFFEARDDISRKQSSARPEELESFCDKCQGEGRHIEEYLFQEMLYNKEVFCSCRKGQRLKEARERYYRAHGRGHTADRPDKKSIKEAKERKPELSEEDSVPF